MIHEPLQRKVLLAHRASKCFLARLDGLLAALLRKPRLDFRASTRRGDKRQPVA